MAAAPGLLFIILPILLLSEGLYWLESNYVQAVYHVPPPVIALMIAAVISIAATNLTSLPAKYNAVVC